MLDVEPVILAELGRLAPAKDLFEPAWDEVLRRARPPRRRLTRRRIALAALAFAIVVYLVVPAFGLGTPFADFFSSKPSPKGVVKDFQLQNVAPGPGGFSPKVLAGKARRITVYHLRTGTPVPLDVAPRRGGGFCYDLGWAGNCWTPNAPILGEAGDHNFGMLDPTVQGLRGSTVIAGPVTNRKIDHLELRFQDKTRVEIPLLWVSKPINAGFYMYVLTRRQHHDGHRPTELVALDSHGNSVAWVRSMFRTPPHHAWDNPRNVSNPAQKQVILRSGQMTIAVAPSRTGGDCWWLEANGRFVTDGCTPPRFLTTPMIGGLYNSITAPVFSAQVKSTVTRVELHFQNGRRVELQPVQGFVLYAIPRTHWPRGTRLTMATAYNDKGRQAFQQPFEANQSGVYPCKKPVPLGHGLTTCP